MGRYKFGKQKKEMLKEEFYDIIEHGRFVKTLLHKSFLVFLYYVGCRKSEALQLIKENFRISEPYLFVEVSAKKHGLERSAFKLNLELPYVSFIMKQLEKTKPKQKIFPISSATAWRIVKRVAPEKYPHYFRLNRTVKFLNNPDVTLNEIRQWMAWKRMETVNSYLGYSERAIGKLSDELE